jgi:heme exporter protein C
MRKAQVFWTTWASLPLTSLKRNDIMSSPDPTTLVYMREMLQYHDSGNGALVWRHPLAEVAQKAAAPIGASFALICLLTGALWGRPTWGTWWVWDARLTSELLLLFLYLGFLALHAAIEDPRRADRAAALLALLGVVNVPVIYFSVKWWNTLHQGASVSLNAAPKMATTMLTAMLIMSLAFWAYAFAVVFTRTRALVLEREHGATWVRELASRQRTGSRP